MLLKPFFKYYVVGIYIFLISHNVLKARDSIHPEWHALKKDHIVQKADDNNTWITITITDTGDIDIYSSMQVFNDTGKDRAELEFEYDAAHEDVEIKYVRVINPDGTVSHAHPTYIKDISLYEHGDPYCSIRARIIYIPQVAAGSVIEYFVRYSKNNLRV